MWPSYFSNTADEVAEWLRRCTAYPLGSSRVSSNLILVDWSFYSSRDNIPIYEYESW